MAGYKVLKNLFYVKEEKKQSLNKMLTTQVTIKASIATVWKFWTTAADIMQWNAPSASWHTSHVATDLKEGGNFLYNMGAKDGSFSFAFSGTYDKVIPNALIEYTVSDGRKSSISFLAEGDTTIVTETFEPETQTPIDQQKSFAKKY
jgi:uncharacterized protein YndB with AHSA1/START domain